MHGMKYYSKEHEWVKLDGDDAIVGIIGIVESVKDSVDVYSPVSGTVIAVNRNLDDDPGIINRSPEEKGWICKLENIDLAEFDDLMEEADYLKYLKTL